MRVLSANAHCRAMSLPEILISTGLGAMLLTVVMALSLFGNKWSSQLINGQTVYQKRRDFVGDGSYYRVTISNANSPVIFSEASAPGPLGRRNVSRNIRVTTVPNGLYRPAIFVKQGIDLGNDFLLDSFDSTSPDSSTNGKYDAAKVQ